MKTLNYLDIFKEGGIFSLLAFSFSSFHSVIERGKSSPSLRSKLVSSAINGAINSRSLYKRNIYTIESCLIALYKPLVLQGSLYFDRGG